MQKHYFELDQVHSITLTMEKESEYMWKEAVPARPKKFLGFTIGTRPGVPAGWSDCEEEDEYDLKHRVQSSYFEKYQWYRVDELAKKVLIKPYIEVRFGYKQSLSKRFETDAEAQAWVDELLASSEKKFHVIINK